MLLSLLLLPLPLLLQLLLSPMECLDSMHRHFTLFECKLISQSQDSEMHKAYCLRSVFAKTPDPSDGSQLNHTDEETELFQFGESANFSVFCSTHSIRTYDILTMSEDEMFGRLM